MTKKSWRQNVFLALVVLWLANVNITVPVAVHAVLAVITLGMALMLLFTVDWAVFKRRPIGQDFLREVMIVLWAVVVGLSFLSFVVQWMKPGGP